MTSPPSTFWNRTGPVHALPPRHAKRFLCLYGAWIDQEVPRRLRCMATQDHAKPCSTPFWCCWEFSEAPLA